MREISDHSIKIRDYHQDFLELHGLKTETGEDTITRLFTNDIEPLIIMLEMMIKWRKAKGN